MVTTLPFLFLNIDVSLLVDEDMPCLHLAFSVSDGSVSVILGASEEKTTDCEYRKNRVCVCAYVFVIICMCLCW